MGLLQLFVGLFYAAAGRHQLLYLIRWLWAQTAVIINIWSCINLRGAIKACNQRYKAANIIAMHSYMHGIHI